MRSRQSLVSDAAPYQAAGARPHGEIERRIELAGVVPRDVPVASVPAGHVARQNIGIAGDEKKALRPFGERYAGLASYHGRQPGAG